MIKLFTLFVAIAIAPCIYAQVNWSSPVSIASSTFGNLHPRISLDRSGNPLVLWGSSGNKAYFSKWTGTSFTTPVALNPGMVNVATASWQGPDITSFGDTVYVSMKQTPEDTGHIYVARSANGGTSFGTSVKADMPGYISRFPVLATDGSGNPIVAFMKFNSSFGNARYVVSRSTDQGMSFPMDALATKAGDSVCDCCPASVISSGNNVIMSYRANRNNIRDVWSCISTNGATSFTNSVQIDQTNWMIMACPSSGPDAIMIGDSLYTVFMSAASGKSLVYFNRGSVSGASAATNIAITGSFTGLSSQNFPRIASFGNAAAIVWIQSQGGVGRVTVRFIDDITKGVGTGYDTIASNQVINADIAMSDGNIHIIWQDDASGTVKYRKGTYSTVAVQEAKKGVQQVAVYPNPAYDYFSVSPVNNAGILFCTLADNSGKQIVLKEAQKADGKLNFSLDDVPSGLYNVVLADSQGNKWYSKLIVER